MNEILNNWLKQQQAHEKQREEEVKSWFEERVEETEKKQKESWDKWMRNHGPKKRVCSNSNCVNHNFKIDEGLMFEKANGEFICKLCYLKLTNSK